MILKNHEKNKKFKFDEVSFNFSWEISSGNSVKTGNEDYGNLLRNIYHYDPSLHEFDAEKFKVSNK